MYDLCTSSGVPDPVGDRDHAFLQKNTSSLNCHSCSYRLKVYGDIICIDPRIHTTQRIGKVRYCNDEFIVGC